MAKMWLSREPSGDKCYVLSTQKPRWHTLSWGGAVWDVRPGSWIIEMSTRLFHKRFPSIRLKPGEGPVRVNVEITEA